MSAKKPDPASDFEALSRQYWNAFAAFSQPQGLSAGPIPAFQGTVFQGPAFQGPGFQGPGFKDGLAWWSQLAGQGREDIDAALERMNAQAGSWFGNMQQLSAGFAGRDAAPADISKAWSDMLGGAGGNPVADMFKRMGGADAQGVETWMAQAAPFLGALRGETSAMLGLPAFGLGREQQERSQRLAQAQIAYQERVNDYNGQLARAAKLAFTRFETKLAERSEPGRQIESARALFDLWIDAAEEAWAEVALTPEYSRVYGEFVNAQMRLRAGVQGEVERAAGMLGLPSRSEVNASHRKLAALERELRALKAQLANAAPVVRAKPVAEVRVTPRPVASKPETKTAAKPASRAKAKSRSARPTRAKAAARKTLPQVVAPRAVVRSLSASKKKQTSRNVATTRKKAR